MSIKENPHRKYYVSEGEAVLCGLTGEVRTPDPGIRNPMLYPTELQSVIKYILRQLLR